MSADLLRRAAKKLREHGEAASRGPWEAESHDLDGTDRITYLALGPDDGHGVRVIPFRTETEDSGYHSQAEADIAYGVLMHPPVALALAAWLDELAKRAEEMDSETCGVWPDGTNHTLAIAREILREPS